MLTHATEATLSHFVAVTQRELSIGKTDVGHASAEMSAVAIPPGRRSESRMDHRQMCSYEVLEAMEGESVVIGQGEAFILNQSTKGILLLTALIPQAKQLIEVHTSRYGWGKTVNIFEAQWARPVPSESQGNLYLLGCRRIFGPCHYWLF